MSRSIELEDYKHYVTTGAFEGTLIKELKDPNFQHLIDGQKRISRQNRCLTYDLGSDRSWNQEDNT